MESIKRIVAAAATCAAATACGGSSIAPSAPVGFFPAVFSGADFVQNAQLLHTAAVPASTMHFQFHAVAPRDGGYAFVIRCAVGSFKIDEGGGFAGGPCRGTSGVEAGCAGGIDRTVTVYVDQRQPSAWGLAIYRSHCQTETPAERRAKEKGAPHPSPQTSPS